MTPALRVEAAAMFCSLGYALPAATAAMRAGLDHFRESVFTDFSDKPVVGAFVDELPYDRLERLVYMFQQVLRECGEQAPALDLAQTPLLLLAAENERHDLREDAAQALFEACVAGRDFHEASRLCAWGRAGLGLALPYARRLLLEKKAERVLVTGLDSYFDFGCIVGFLRSKRLIIDGNSDGFHPGEGAGAVLLTLEEGGRGGLHITGVGAGEEPGHYMQPERPNLAAGLTAAIRAAVAECGHKLTETCFHYSDCAGEAFYFKEAVQALLRCLEHTVPAYPHLVAGSTLGETGAAVGPLLLAHCSRLLERADGFGRRALLHFSSDYGRRAAVILEYRHHH